MGWNPRERKTAVLKILSSRCINLTLLCSIITVLIFHVLLKAVAIDVCTLYEHLKITGMSEIRGVPQSPAAGACSPRNIDKLRNDGAIRRSASLWDDPFRRSLFIYVCFRRTVSRNKLVPLCSVCTRFSLLIRFCVASTLSRNVMIFAWMMVHVSVLPLFSLVSVLLSVRLSIPAPHVALWRLSNSHLKSRYLRLRRLP